MLLLDTNVVSELRKFGSPRANPGVVAWIRDLDPLQLHISAVTVLEIEAGVLRAERKDPEHGRRLRLWLENQVMREFASRILPVDADVARHCALLMARRTCELEDALIAATAFTNRLAVATRNVRDFEPLGVRVVNPWSE